MDPFMMSSSSPPLPPAPTVDIGQALESQQVGSYHRRAHSDSNFRSISYDDLARFDPFDIDWCGGPPPLPIIPNDPVASMELPMVIDFSPEKSNSLNSELNRSVEPPIGHLRCMSMDSDFLDYVVDGEGFGGASENFGCKVVVQENPVIHPGQSTSMDGSTNMSLEVEPSTGNEVVKKAMPLEKLAELALVDPKRAKRILANRQSAARSKERKTRYTIELEKKVQTLQAEANNLSAKIGKIEKDNTDWRAENKELKLGIEAMDKQAKLRDELNESLRIQLQQLKKERSQRVAFKKTNFSLLASQFASQLALHQVTRIRSRQARQPPQLGTPPSSSGQPKNGQSGPDLSCVNPQN